nr:carboxylesterase [Liposcelis bostrychophila]
MQFGSDLRTSYNREKKKMTESQPIIRIADGSIRGEKSDSIRGGSYYSFKGIPYAKPPVGDLRFKAPVPVEPWTGVRDALKHGSEAPAKDMLKHEYMENTSEDCLFINVYTPELPKSKNDKLKSVLVWVHGGGFSMGSGNSEIYGPDYLITEDVVLVTFNYRLGVLGFLSLGTVECPGNFGLKDMVLALKWVQKNIAAFGGDPNNVTIFGESAGGAAVQYLLISKATRGLFHKAISQSGTTLDPWAHRLNPRDFAFALGEELGCKTTDDKVLLDFLKKASQKDFVEKEGDLPKKLYPDRIFLQLSFVPVVEPEHEGAFLTKSPREIIQSGDFNDVPYIIGGVSLEGLIIIYRNFEYKESTADEDLEQVLPLGTLNIQKGSKESKEITKKIRDFYFPNGYEKEKLVAVLSAIYFLNGIGKTCDWIGRLKNRNSPTYLYHFLFDGTKAFLKHLIGYGDWKGTCHADELGYLFHMPMLQAKLEPNTPEYTTVQRMTKLWTDFAKTGNPTPKDNSWKPISENDNTYLEIEKELTLKKNFNEKEAKLWNEIYKSVCTRHK